MGDTTFFDYIKNEVWGFASYPIQFLKKNKNKKEGNFIKRIAKLFTVMLVMVMVLTGATPTVTEAKVTKTSITVTNKSTGKKVGKKLTLTQGKKLQLKVKYGKTNITKKAKYKTSNKNVTISKKGKITAKKVGATTVIIKYKKKTKTIKVTVKAKVVQTTTEQTTTEQAKKKPKKKPKKTYDEKNVISSEEAAEAVRQKMAQCSHEWKPSFYSDVEFPDEQLYAMYKEHLFLWGVFCSKCGVEMRTTSVPFVEASAYTNEQLNSCVVSNVEDAPCHSKGASHHHYVKIYTRWGNMWDTDLHCMDCGAGKSY